MVVIMAPRAMAAVTPVIVPRSNNDDPVWWARGRHDHDTTRRRAIRAADDHRLAAARLAVVIAIMIIGDGGEQKAGCDTDRGAFGRPMIVVFADDGAGDATEDGVTRGVVVVGVESGRDDGEQASRACEREKKAGFHTPT
ncbi:MAG: hypothetical protein QM691_10820 [Opitutaceae bacterium]